MPNMRTIRCVNCSRTMNYLSRWTICFLVVFGSTVCFGQNQNDRWFFGNRGHLSFLASDPVASNSSQMVSIEGVASVSDPSSGELLFYTNGIQVWDRNNAVMPNGNGLLAGVNTSASQGVVIVPFPGKADLFYVFTVDESSNFSNNGLRYSLIDMSLNMGMGDVVADHKNILVYQNVTERLSVAENATESGYWLMVHERDSDAFLAFEVTSNGLTFNPVISSVGLIHNSIVQGNGDATMGCMKFNNAFNRLAVALYSLNVVQFFDFDNCSGFVSNAQTINTSDNPYGVVFSPDDSKLYFSVYVTASFAGVFYQVNMLAANIPATVTPIGISSSDNFASVGAMELGPDGKIYCSINSEAWLSVIDAPNALGPSCNFIDQGVILPPVGLFPTTGLLGLPQPVLFLEDLSLPKLFGPDDVCLNQNADISFTGISATNQSIWYVNDSLISQNTPNVNLSFDSVGTYELVFVYNDGCYVSDTLRTLIQAESCSQNLCLVEVPNVFTPDDSQTNDFFELAVNCQLESFHITILNRWGEVVFESNDPQFQWDGTYKSRDLSEGVYFYKLSYLESTERFDYQGFIHLVR